MRHPNQSLLLRFTAGLLDEREASRIVSHLGDCEPCTLRYQALQELRHDFDGSWESFLEEASFRAGLAPRAEAATASTVVLAAFRGLLQRSTRLASAALDRMGQFATPGATLQAAFAPSFSGVADPAASAEAQAETEAASLALSRGDLLAAIDHLRRASLRDPESSASAEVALRLGNEIAGRVVVDGPRAAVSVLVYPQVLKVSGGAIVLDAGHGAAPIRSRFEPLPGSGNLLAEIEDVPDGPFSIRVEVDAP